METRSSAEPTLSSAAERFSWLSTFGGEFIEVRLDYLNCDHPGKLEDAGGAINRPGVFSESFAQHETRKK